MPTTSMLALENLRELVKLAASDAHRLKLKLREVEAEARRLETERDDYDRDGCQKEKRAHAAERKVEVQKRDLEARADLMSDLRRRAEDRQERLEKAEADRDSWRRTAERCKREADAAEHQLHRERERLREALTKLADHLFMRESEARDEREAEREVHGTDERAREREGTFAGAHRAVLDELATPTDPEDDVGVGAEMPGSRLKAVGLGADSSATCRYRIEPLDYDVWRIVDGTGSQIGVPMPEMKAIRECSRLNLASASPEPESESVTCIKEHVEACLCPGCSPSQDSGVTQADLDRGEELDARHGWSASQPDCSPGEAGGEEEATPLKWEDGDRGSLVRELRKVHKLAGGLHIEDPVMAVRKLKDSREACLKQHDEAVAREADERTHREFAVQKVTELEAERDSRLTKESVADWFSKKIAEGDDAYVQAIYRIVRRDLLAALEAALSTGHPTEGAGS